MTGPVGRPRRAALPHRATVPTKAQLVRSRRRRLRLLALGIGVALLGLVGRLVIVQVLDGTNYAAYASSEIRQTVTLPAARGSIYDRAGRLLALSVPTDAVIADDYLIANPIAVASELAPLLAVPAAHLASLLTERHGYVVLAPAVSSAVGTEVTALAVNGLTLQPGQRRLYPDQTAFEPVLGGLYASGQGDAGIEYAENGLLSGRSGSELLAESAAGQALPTPAENVVQPRQGAGVVLSLDEPLQVVATRDVAAAMAKTGSDSGVAIIEDVHTGAILAMVDLTRGPKGVIVPAAENLALTSVYQPGSVMKIATFSFSLQDHLITPTTSLTVPFQIDIGGYWFQDAEYHPTQSMSTSQILSQSSNVGTIEVSRILGPQRLDKALKALGFGKPTGLGWPGASDGIIGSPATWYGSSLGSVPIGTGVAVTPMQILDSYNTVANGGTFVTPQLVAGTVGTGGSQHLATSGARHRVLQTSTVRELVPMLEGVVQDGTAVCAAVPGYTVAGKTGTAQVPKQSGLGYVPGDWNATFVGFIPAQAPQLSGIVWLNHTGGVVYGGSVSAPVFSQIMGWALSHFHVAAPAARDTQATSLPAICNGA